MKNIIANINNATTGIIHPRPRGLESNGSGLTKVWILFKINAPLNNNTNPQNKGISNKDHDEFE